jgi:hypothetical protein
LKEPSVADRINEAPPFVRALRSLEPIQQADLKQASGNQRMRRAAFTLGLLAVIVEFAISGNTLANFGIDYASPGGNPLVKLHPGTYLVSLAAFMVLFLARPAGSGLTRFFKGAPALASFLGLTLFCALYSIVNVGFSGAATYVESYLSAGLLALVIEGGTDRQKRTLAWWIIAFSVISVIISLGEGATQTHLIPLHFGDESTQALSEDQEDFRGAGLFGHPLTAALSTSMAIFMLLRMRMNGMLKAALFTTLLIGLLTFGGRAALGVTLVMVTTAATVALVCGLVMRNLSVGFMGAIAAATLILPPLMVMLVTSTDIGERILTHMYVDDSAEVRSLQWAVLQHLNLPDVLFGVPPARLDIIKYQIGLGEATTDIENFWLLMFLNLGSIGFVVFLVALGLFLAHLGRTTNHPLGWMLMASAILIDSTSNSLGRKSADLFFMAACMVAMTGYSQATSPVSAERKEIAETQRQARQNLVAVLPRALRRGI